VGSDPLGDRLLAELAAAGVDVAVQRGGRTGSIVILFSADGERSMLPDRGDAVALDAVDPTALDGCSWLHVPAYSLLVQPIGAACLALAEEAHRRGLGVSVDASSSALVEQTGRAEARAAMEAAAPDVVLANRDEAEALDLLRRPFPGDVRTVVKAGPDPVEVVGAERLTIEVPPVANVRDTTGAGDAFAAGLLGALVRGAGTADAVLAGSALAARVLTMPGATLAPAVGAAP
jgi:sugar/nucleoside kinase (ribokinase family)